MRVMLRFGPYGKPALILQKVTTDPVLIHEIATKAINNTPFISNICYNKKAYYRTLVDLVKSGIVSIDELKK
jgi:hypothetical protein